MRRLVIFSILAILLLPLLASAQSLTSVTDKLNFFNVTELSSEKNHTIIITWDGTGLSGAHTLFFELPSSFNFSQGYQEQINYEENCGNLTVQGFLDSTVECRCDSVLRRGNCTLDLSAENQIRFMVSPQDPNFIQEQTLFPLKFNVTNSTLNYSGEINVTFIKFNDREIFHTLVEFGRGRGNYFLDTFAPGLGGSGHTEQACNAVPADTLFELNYLHKVLNIKQYFQLATAVAKDATWQCSYPNNSIVREHLVTSITREPTWNFSYKIPEIEGSWERQGFAGQDFDADETVIDTVFNVNCTNLVYNLEEAGGNITVNKDDFYVITSSKNPFVVNATPDLVTPVIGNGSSEIIFNYNITNDEDYEVREVIIEILAPEFGQFIGTRGELWGIARDRFTLSLARMGAGDSIETDLVVRFNTTEAPAGTTLLNISNSIQVKHVPCWEINAYNPNEYFQSSAGIGTINIDMSINVSIVKVQNILTNINISVSNLEETIISINNTVNNIFNFVQVINTTVFNINQTVVQINNTVFFINQTILAFNASATVNFQSILGNLSLIVTNTTINITEILLAINNTNDLIISINQTLFLQTQNLSISIQNNFTNIFTDLTLIIEKLDNISINTSNDLIISVNDSVTQVLERVQRLREFDEELVFLVTDSFGLVQEAAGDLDKGDTDSAIAKLQQSNIQLEETPLFLDSWVFNAYDSLNNLL